MCARLYRSRTGPILSAREASSVRASRRTSPPTLRCAGSTSARTSASTSEARDSDGLGAEAERPDEPAAHHDALAAAGDQAPADVEARPRRGDPAGDAG